MSVLLRHEPIHTVIDGDLPPKAVKALARAFTYTPEDAKYRLRAAQKRGWHLKDDGAVCLLQQVDGHWVFPSGLLETALRLLDSLDVEHTVEDRTPPSVLTPDAFVWNSRYALRDYQERQADAVCERRRGVIKSCTGSGKTITIAASLKGAMMFPALVVTHTDTLLHQTHDRLEEILGTSVGLIGRKGGKAVRDIRPITVATIQSIVSDIRKDAPDLDIRQYLNGIQALHIDECHHVRADTCRIVNALCCNAGVRIGWSGTPFREQGDDVAIEGALGPTLAEYSYTDAITGGYIVAPTIHIFNFQPNINFDRNATYNDVVSEYVVGDVKRNRSIANITRKLMEKGEKTLVLVERIEHGEMLSEFIGTGIPFVQGKNPAKYRDAVIAGLSDGTHPCVVATALFDEGVDIPEATALVLAHPNKSLVKTYQRIGRVLRKSEGKSKATIVDIQDDVTMLTHQARRRTALYRKEPSFIIKDHSHDGIRWYGF
jgi:superfamily II DNA or RNA helicase